MLLARRESRQNALLLVSTRADNKRKAEPLAIGLVQTLKARDLIRRETIQSRSSLFAGRGRGECSSQSCATYQVRMSLEQRHLLSDRSIIHYLAERLVQLLQA